jgi:DNA mismatch repair protein MutS2
MIYPLNFENKIGFDVIRQKVKELCLFELGKQKVDNMVFSVNAEEISLSLALTSEFKLICQYEDNFPVDFYFDVTPSLRKAKIEGAFLTEEEVFNLQRSLQAIKQIILFFKKAEEIKYPRLKKITKEITYHEQIEKRIDLIITKHGKIKDNASPELHKIRKEIQQYTVAVSRKLQQILKKAIEDGLVDKDASLSIRNGRQVIPIQATHKRRIEGIIHDESSTGRTAYIEPSEVVAINNEIRELEYAENREIIKILTGFTNEIRPYIDDLLKSYDFLGTIDFIRAKALFAISINAVQPVIINESGIKWQQACHPLLFLHHKAEKKEVVPLDIKLDAKNRILIISGPNAGGKSVCLQTVGLLQYMLQCGMLVPMNENSKAGLFKDLFIDIGDEQSIENDLSTYSSHLLAMKYFLRHASTNTLILIDEFGSGTEPLIGGAIAEAILEGLNQKGVWGVITTHYSNLKHFASSTNGIINGAMLFDTGKIQPLYRLEIGKPGSSFAIDIARKIGLPEEILKHASLKAGKNHINFDRHLREIIRDKHYWETKRDKIRIAEKEFTGIVERYSEELSNVQKLEKEILNQARKHAEELISKANREIENTIRIIRESQADKEKTKTARAELEKLKLQIASEDYENNKRLTSKIKQIKQHGKKFLKDFDNKENDKISISERADFNTGDLVRIKGQEAVGEVLDIHNDSCMIALGSMITTVKSDKLEKLNKNEQGEKKYNEPRFQSYSSVVLERKMNFKPDIDIRGMRGEEALEKVSRLIDEAVVVGAKELKILHGKGNGILKQLIRDYLRTLEVVKSYSDEHVERGGAGITLVTLDY